MTDVDASSSAAPAAIDAVSNTSSVAVGGGGLPLRSGGVVAYGAATNDAYGWCEEYLFPSRC